MQYFTDNNFILGGFFGQLFEENRFLKIASPTGRYNIFDCESLSLKMNLT